MIERPSDSTPDQTALHSSDWPVGRRVAAGGLRPDRAGEPDISARQAGRGEARSGGCHHRPGSGGWGHDRPGGASRGDATTAPAAAKPAAAPAASGQGEARRHPPRRHGRTARIAVPVPLRRKHDAAVAVRPADPLRRSVEAAATAGREVAVQPGQDQHHVQPAPERDLSLWQADDGRRRHLHLQVPDRPEEFEQHQRLHQSGQRGHGAGPAHRDVHVQGADPGRPGHVRPLLGRREGRARHHDEAGQDRPVRDEGLEAWPDSAHREERGVLGEGRSRTSTPSSTASSATSRPGCSGSRARPATS